MIYAFDSYYTNDKATTICIGFKDMQQSNPDVVFKEITDIKSDYEPGAFYKRELPCIVHCIEKNNITDIDFFIVDGYVFLDNNNKHGLGAHLYNYYNAKYPVIGVAKTNFATLTQNKSEIIRGESIKPLFVTAIGIDLTIATQLIQNMHGVYRIPTLLKLLDQLTKEEFKILQNTL